LLSAASLALIWFSAGAVSAQQASPTASAASGTQDCADFDTQEAAQAFYDQHVSDTPGNPDPFDLDTDGDGKACEGLPTAASSPTASAAATASPTTTSGQPLPQSGAETGVIALSGLSLLELGYGLTLASRRLGVRRRAIPLYLLRKFATAARKGDGHVQVAEDMYLVHRSVLESGTSQKALAPVPETIEEENGVHDDVRLFDIERDGAPNVTAGEYPNVYAALARPGAVRDDSRH
jgi:hypothetical protein